MNFRLSVNNSKVVSFGKFLLTYSDTCIINVWQWTAMGTYLRVGRACWHSPVSSGEPDK